MLPQLPDLFPLCRAHTAPVLDTAWSPFDDDLVASVGEDGKLALTRVDGELLHDAWSGDRKDLPDMEPLWRLNAHGRKAGHVRFHPSAANVLATASNDVKVWDLEAQKSVLQSETHADMVQSIDWDWCGSVYATTCKDKKLRIFDPRAGSAAVTVADSHSGVKGSRVTWLGSLDRIVTTGFSRTSDRQTFLWDSRELTKGPIKQMNIDQSSGMLMPFFIPGNKCVACRLNGWLDSRLTCRRSQCPLPCWQGVRFLSHLFAVAAGLTCFAATATSACTSSRRTSSSTCAHPSARPFNS